MPRIKHDNENANDQKFSGALPTQKTFHWYKNNDNASEDTKKNGVRI